MATCGNTSKTSSLIQDISHQLTCSICLDHYKIPKTLTPCLHTFCQKCLQQYINSTATKDGIIGSFACPKCRSNAEFDCPDLFTKENAAEKQFKTNFDIQSQLDVIKNKTANGCSEHTGEMLMFFCKTCARLICQLCLDDDDHLPQGHKLVTVKREAHRVRAEFKSKQQTINKMIDYHQQTRSQHQAQLTKLAEKKVNANKLIQCLESYKAELQDIISEIAAAEQFSKETIENIEIYQGAKERLNQIMSGTDDLQLLQEKMEVEAVVVVIEDLQCLDAVEPLPNHSGTSLIEIYERISDELKDMMPQVSQSSKVEECIEDKQNILHSWLFQGTHPNQSHLPENLLLTRGMIRQYGRVGEQPVKVCNSGYDANQGLLFKNHKYQAFYKAYK